jgi:ribonucleoside-diphosphate reductase alpha chain
VCAAHSIDHPAYGQLAGRYYTKSFLHAIVPVDFGSALEAMKLHRSDDKSAPLVDDSLINAYNNHADVIEAALCPERDFSLDYFGVKTLTKSYLIRGADGQIMERPQHMYMRVALAVHVGGGGSIADALDAYEDLSMRNYTHATPTLFNAGTRVPQLSSCFLLGVAEDSVTGIFDTLKMCAQISKTAGGIGLNVSNVRASGSFIVGTQGKSNGLVPMLKVFNDTARYIDQGGGKRRGAFAIYIEPWHADIFEVLDLKLNQGQDELRARDLFYAMWMCDLFMERVETDAQWSLMCPDRCKGLQDAYGDDFKALYEEYEVRGKFVRQVSARSLWAKIIETQMETGGPYMLYKDACNRKSNHRHLGVIRCSNLCTEVVQFTSRDEVAVCNLGSLCLPAFVSSNGFDFDGLRIAAERLAVALDRVIDVNHYPVPEARASNQAHRPIGIGVQGLADVFARLMLPYDSDAARQLNKDIFETIYFAALTASCRLAVLNGPYGSYDGSPASRGVLQVDMWDADVSDRWDWATLRASIATHGLRNSLLTAPMPTASTAQIAGNTESFEPCMSNVVVRRVLSGEFVVINRHLVAALEREGLWPELRKPLLRANGSVQNLPVSQSIKDVFRTVWEMKQRPLMVMAAERGPYVDQSQSLNVFMADATAAKLNALHFCTWRLGLKTGMYYLHTRPITEAVQFTLVDETDESSGPCETCSA